MPTAIVLRETGDPGVLRPEEVAVGEPGPGEVRVRHAAIGINFIDTYQRSGLYPLPSLPHGIGMEAAGVVEAVGEAVTGVAVGDRVAYAGGPPGAYAEARLLPPDRLVPVPDAIDDRTAAAALLKGMTVEYLIRRAFRVEPEMTVLLHAAAGGVGTIAIQWLADLGATVIGTVGSAAKVEHARSHGCHEVLVVGSDGDADWPARVRELTAGRGVPVVYDGVGRTTFEGSLSSLARRGTLVAFGNASGPPPPLDLLELSRRGSLYVTRPTLFDYTASRDELLASAAAVFDAIGRGAVRVEIGRTWPLAEAAEAHRALEARATTGSSLLLP